MTEQAELSAESEAESRFWWSSPHTPVWTESDRLLAGVLGDAGFQLLVPQSDIKLSKIFRTPALSTSRAVALAGLLGAKRVVVGTVVYRAMHDLPLGLRGVEATVELQLVDVHGDVSGGGSETLETGSVRVALQRAEFGERLEGLLPAVRRNAMTALGRVLASSLHQTHYPVGIAAQEKRLVFRHLRAHRHLEAIRTFLKSLQQVNDIRESWASEGTIALEINPGQLDDQEFIAQISRALAAQTFEGFVLAPDAAAAFPSSVAFELQPSTTSPEGTY